MWFLAALVILIILLIPTAYAGLIGAPFVPTRKKIIDKTLEEIHLKKNDLVIDLGSGDGAVLIAAVRRGAQAVGYELSPIMWAIGWLRLISSYRVNRPPSQTLSSVSSKEVPATIRPYIKFGNFFHQHLPAETTIVFAFLLPKTMPHLKEYLSQQHLPKLRYILTSTFPFPNEKSFRVVEVKNLGKIYIYKPLY